MADLNQLPIRAQIRELQEEMIRFRRDLHAHPERGMQEERTAKRVAEALKPHFPDVQTGIAKTGVSTVLRPEGSIARAIMMRADMDALPIQEESSAEYASRTPGVMHACGHDGHTSILLHAAEVAAADPEAFGGSVRFVFQPAEEQPGGAVPMIREGILTDPPIEAAFGLHLWNSLPTGKVAVTAGPMMAAADEFELVVRGRGGHGALPHQTVDAIVIASHLVVALQTLVSRNADPTKTAVVSIGVLNAGENFNVIAETARLRGTMRTFDAQMREELIRRLREVAEGVCTTFGAECELHFEGVYPALVNDPTMADFVAKVAAEVVGQENVIRDLTLMGAEDMSFFLREVPGAYFFLGAGSEERGLTHPHHSPYFDFDEDAMPIGAEIFLRIMERYWTAFPEPPAKSPQGGA
jgi:amidohydrolase